MRQTLLILCLCALAACAPPPTSNDIQRQQQERILAEGNAEVGMPAIKNFRERKLLKDIYELRDQDGLVTYTYLWNQFNGKLVFLCDSIGYGIPYATQFTAPESVQSYNLGSDVVQGSSTSAHDNQQYWGVERLPQADPNGLFSPSNAEGTWVLCKDPNGPTTQPLYIEPRVVVSPFKLASK